jgi:hypothetical protein
MKANSVSKGIFVRFLRISAFGLNECCCQQSDSMRTPFSSVTMGETECTTCHLWYVSMFDPCRNMKVIVLASDATAFVVSLRDAVHCLVLNTVEIPPPRPTELCLTSILRMVVSMCKPVAAMLV